LSANQRHTPLFPSAPKEHKSIAYTTMASATPSAAPSSDSTEKYHALIIDSGAIIKQSTFTHLHHSASHFYTVPAVLAEVRDAKSRAHLEEFQVRLSSLRTVEGKEVKLETRLPSKESVAAVSEFARKTGDYAQLSGVDLQILALLYELEVEACEMFGNSMEHVRREPKRVLGVSVKALAGDGKRVIAKSGRVRDGDSSVASESGASSGVNSSSLCVNSFFDGSADGIVDAADVDIEYYDELDDESKCGEESIATADVCSNAPGKSSSWAKLVNPTKASSAPPLNYSLATSQRVTERLEEPSDLIVKDPMHVDEEIHGQFDDASESSEESNTSESEESDDDAEAMAIANAESNEEMSDEECDVFILEPHEAAYYKKLREQKDLNEKKQSEVLIAQFGSQKLDAVNEDAGLDSEFPSLAAAAEVPYEGSDDEIGQEDAHESLDWEREEEERKKRSLQPMINGRVKAATPKYNSFRKYGHVLSAEGSGSSLKKAKETKGEKANSDNAIETADVSNTPEASSNTEYKSKFTTGAASALDAPSEMTADDDDGEGWVTCTRDIQTIKSTGSLHLSKSSDSRKNNHANQPPKNPAPPVSQRAACATTDFAMQNVILQMNLELLSVDGVRVRRLKTWVTRCAACFTIYGGNDDKKGKSGGKLFCDKCGSNNLQRIAASVDRNSGRLKLHMKKNYQYNTRGTKFSLPKAGKGNKYEGDLLLTEDQLMYGAWAQKVRKGKSKSLGESMFGSGLAADLGCRADLTKRDDIKVGFGRRNPNSSKFGRERRGKKKKNTQDKACGLRRY
jgi:RNA-binding protein NOB1